MLTLAFRMLRHRTSGFVGTFVALFFGAAIVTACGGLLETGVRTAVPQQRTAQAAIIVTATQTTPRPIPVDPEDPDIDNATLSERIRLDRDVVAKIRAVPGVTDAVADISFPATLMRDGMPVVSAKGHGWQSAALLPYPLGSGAEPKSGEVVLDRTLAAGIAVGDRVDIVVRGEVTGFRVAGISTAAVTEPALFFAPGQVSALTGRDTVDSVAVLASPGRDVEQLAAAITAAAGVPVVAHTGEDRGTAEFPEADTASESLIVIAAVSGGLSVMVAMFVVGSTLGLSIRQRSRELALLRAIGTTPRQLRRMVLGEALAIAAVAATLGSLPGGLLGRFLHDRLGAHGVIPPVIEYRQGWIPMVVGIGAALIATAVAAVIAARRAGNTRPTEALAESALPTNWLTWGRGLLAGLCFAGGTALAIVTVTVMTGPVAVSTAGPSVMIWAVGLALISPGITKAVAAVVRWPLRAVSGIAGELALINTRARIQRVAAAVTPIMLATGIATANMYLQTSQAAAAEAAFVENLRADAVLTSTVGGLPAGLVEQVRQVPGVAGASEFVTSDALITSPYDSNQGDEGYPVQGVSADGVAATTAVTATSGLLTDLRGATVALPAERATALGLGIGDSVRMRFGDAKEVDLRLVATYPSKAGFESILLPASLLVEHTTSGMVDQIMVAAAPGVDSATVVAALGELAGGHPGVLVGDKSAMTQALADNQRVGMWVNYLMVGMIVAYTVIAVVNTLVMATLARRREFGLQRLTGSTRGQVLRMMGVEGLLVAIVGVLLGTLVSTTTLVPFSLVVSDSVLPAGPLSIYLVIVGSALLLALAATLLPTLAATRSRPAEAVTGSRD